MTKLLGPFVKKKKSGQRKNRMCTHDRKSLSSHLINNTCKILFRVFMPLVLCMNQCVNGQGTSRTVSFSCVVKILWPGCWWNLVLEAGSLRSGCQYGCVRVIFLVADFSLQSHMVEGSFTFFKCGIYLTLILLYDKFIDKD